MNEAPVIRYAGFWKRANAYGYDLIICQLFALVPMFLFYRFPSMSMITENYVQGYELLDRWFTNFGYYVVAISLVYNVYYTTGPRNATPGKRFCDCYVVHKDGMPLSLFQASLRHVMCCIGTFTWGLGFLTVAFTREKLAPHDMICQTRVLVKEKPPKKRKKETTS